MAESQPALKKPQFTKVNQLRPLSTGLTLTVKVVDSKIVKGPQGRQVRTAECLVGDETAMIVFTARNDQVDEMKQGATVTLRNAKVEMYRGSMRLAVDRWGRIEPAEPANFTVNEDNNMSLIEFERVDCVN